MYSHHYVFIFVRTVVFLLGGVIYEVSPFLLYSNKQSGYQHGLGKRFIDEGKVRLGVTNSFASYSGKNIHCTWKDKDEINHDLTQMKISIEEYIDWHVPVVLYGVDSCSKEGASKDSCQPQWFRSTYTDDDNMNQKQEVSVLPTNVKIADKVAEETMRWCQNFVANLNLCPWAKSSLLTQNAIRIKIVPQSVGWVVFQNIVRSSAMELLRITPPLSRMEDYANGKDCADNNNNKCQPSEDFVDPNAAITFIVVAPNYHLQNDDHSDDIVISSDYNYDFEFSMFYENFVNLEETILDEADEAVSSILDKDNSFEYLKERIGDHVTFAPFHPDWTFLTDNNEDGITRMNNPLDYEKRTPYPTVSLVRTSAVMAAGEETTIRIGHHNEEVLNQLGSKSLESIFQNQVLQNDYCFNKRKE